MQNVGPDAQIVARTAKNRVIAAARIDDVVTRITCKKGRIQEARVCLSKELEPVPCGRDTIKDCSMKNALFDPVR